MPASVVLVLNDIHRADRISDELSTIGIDAVCCFSSSEVLAAVLNKQPDAVLVDAEIDGSEDLMRWLGRMFKGTVCLVHEFEGSGSEGPGGRRSEEVIWGVDETDDVVARVIGALATKPPAVARSVWP